MKEKLLEYLQSQRLMTIATASSGRPWVATVYYTVDDDFNLYFVSKPTTRHVEEIMESSRVACAIAGSSQKVTDKKIGAQIQGAASEVRGAEKMKQILKMWNESNAGFEGVINYENIKNKVIKSRVYQVKPTFIKFFNEDLYGPEGADTIKF